MNIIADIAGRYEELMLLLEKMPKGEEIILLGDLNDRGPDSDKVIQWAIDNKIRCVKSNHGSMLIDAYYHTKAGLFLSEQVRLFHMNGGHQTALSYGGLSNIPQSHIDYLDDCPWYIETPDLILSHAPLSNYNDNPFEHLNEEFVWNREIPNRRDKFQIHGHNSLMETYTDELGDYGMCLDDCFNNRLTGIHWPSKTIYTQDYL